MNSAAISAERWMAAPSSMRNPPTRESWSAARAAAGRRTHCSGGIGGCGDSLCRTSIPPTAKWAATDTIKATISEAKRNP